MMYGIYVHETQKEPYATQIVAGKKIIDTRTRDMLGKLVGERVLVIRTRSGHKADIIGAVTIIGKVWFADHVLNYIRDRTCIPKGSKYDTHNGGKWCYYIADPIEFIPMQLENLTVLSRNMSFAKISFLGGASDVN